eukprot:jgi/Chrzof1/3539/UNPLg00748.t1
MYPSRVVLFQAVVMCMQALKDDNHAIPVDEEDDDDFDLDPADYSTLPILGTAKFHSPTYSFSITDKYSCYGCQYSPNASVLTVLYDIIQIGVMAVTPTGFITSSAEQATIPSGSYVLDR